eukprot:11614-Eustigmatos_ZCMA.PRE.1
MTTQGVPGDQSTTRYSLFARKGPAPNAPVAHQAMPAPLRQYSVAPTDARHALERDAFATGCLGAQHTEPNNQMLMSSGLRQRQPLKPFQ